MIKNIFFTIMTITISSSIYTSDSKMALQKPEHIAILYDTLKRQHARTEIELRELEPLILATPTLPGTDNAKKIFREIKEQEQRFSWYLSYPAGWKENYQQQKFSPEELEVLITLQEASTAHLKTIHNCFDKYNKATTNLKQNSNESELEQK